ncbi:MAG: hypothetical protein FWC97_10315 [Treponema sp.]|nr:hypothetical protein [Treponema sp.]
MKDMNDLQVENYDAKEVGTKKQSLVKRAATAGGAIVLLFNLTGCPFPIVAGGAGAWFHSCAVDECECDECECTDDECAEEAE